MARLKSVSLSTHSEERVPLAWSDVWSEVKGVCLRPGSRPQGNRFENMCHLAQAASLQRQSKSFQGSRTTARVETVPGSAGLPGWPQHWPRMAPAGPCPPPPPWKGCSKVLGPELLAVLRTPPSSGNTARAPPTSPSCTTHGFRQQGAPFLEPTPHLQLESGLLNSADSLARVRPQSSAVTSSDAACPCSLPPQTRPGLLGYETFNKCYF